MKRLQIELSPTIEVAMNLASDEASSAGRKFIWPEHLILGMLRESRGEGARALARLGANLPQMRALIRDSFPEPSDEVITGTLPLHPFTRRATRRAAMHAVAEGFESVGDQHLLLAIIDRPRPSVARVLEKAGISLEHLRLLLTGKATTISTELHYRRTEPKRRWWHFGR
jgi:ATP-dependent Clp protease ATP-binding subunit ClpC